MDVVAGTATVIDFPHQIKQPRVHPGGLVAPPVPQQTVDLFHSLRIEPAIAFEGDRRFFARMGEIKFESAVFCSGGCRRAQERGNGKKHGHDEPRDAT